VSDFTSPASINEIPLLKELHKKYSDHIEFLTVAVDSLNWTKQQAEVYKKISWKKTAVKSNDKLIESYKIRNFPRYILIDPQGYIVNPTSLGPTPDAQYETIEKTFYFIQRMNTKEKEFIPGE
jgi:cytochrome oxidase Cu insertion factor (SCO1/SenC/PrrC family)